MEQNSQNQNKNDGLFQKNQIFIAVGVIVVLAAIILLSTKDKDDKNKDLSNNQEQTEQVAGENSSDNQDPGTDSTPNQVAPGAETANVTASGTLRSSDDNAKGNLMLVGEQGKIYVSTQRDFSALLNQPVTLNAQGSLNRFTFLGFGTTPADMGGAPDEDQSPLAPVTNNVTFTGKLQLSNNANRGNYMVVSGPTTVYLKSVRDYTSLVDSTVVLTATGTLDSFTQARLIKK